MSISDFWDMPWDAPHVIDPGGSVFNVLHQKFNTNRLEPNGENDFYPIIQAAIEAAEVAGGWVDIPKGRYYLSQPLRTRHMNDGTISGSGVRGITICGDGQMTVLTRNQREVADYTPEFTLTSHDQVALAIYGSNNIVERLSIEDSKVGILLGQDPDNVSASLGDLSFNGFNRIRHIWYDGVGTPLMLEPGQGIYYNTFTHIHGETVQIGVHLAPPFDPTRSSLVPNRNTFADVRFTRAWVGVLAQNGDTNTFREVHCEGVAIGKSGKLGDTPPEAIKRQVGTLTSAHSGAIAAVAVTGFSSGLTRGRLENDRYLWLQNAAGEGEYVRLDGAALDGATSIPIDAATLTYTYAAGDVVYEATPTAIYMDDDAYSYGLQLDHFFSCHYEQCDRDVVYDGYGHGFSLNGINVQRKFDIKVGATLESFFGAYASDLKIGLLQGPFGVNGYDSALAPGEYVGAWVTYADALHAPIRDRGYDLAEYDILANAAGVDSLYTSVDGSCDSDYYSLAGECRWRLKMQFVPTGALVGTQDPVVLTPPLPLDDFHYVSSTESQFRGFAAAVRVGTAEAVVTPIIINLSGQLEISPPVNWRADQANFIHLSITYRWDPEA